MLGVLGHVPACTPGKERKGKEEHGSQYVLGRVWSRMECTELEIN